MIEGFVVTIWLLISVFGIFEKRYSKLYSVIAFLYIAVVIGLNTKTPDYFSYRSIYNSGILVAAKGNVEVGFLGICLFFNFIGFSYEQFRFCWGAVIALLFVISARRLSRYSNYILGLFIIYPLIGWISGIRFAMASAIVCFNIHNLTKGRKGSIKYIIGIVIAASIHISVLFYLIFLFAKRRYKMKQYVLFFFSVFLLLVLVRTGIIVNIVQKTSGPYVSHKITRWLSKDDGVEHPDFIRFFCQSAIVIIYSFLVNEISKGIKRSFYYRLSEKGMNEKIILYKNISFFMLLIIPLFTMAVEYQRFLIGVFPVYYAIFAEYKYAYCPKRNIDRKLYLLLCGLSPIMYLLFFMITNRGNFDAIGALSHNFIFGIKPDVGRMVSGR